MGTIQIIIIVMMPRPQRTRSSENDRTRFFPFVSFAVFFHVPPFSVFLSSFECDLPPQRCARHSFLLSRSKKYLYRNNRDRFVSTLTFLLFFHSYRQLKITKKLKMKTEERRNCLDRTIEELYKFLKSFSCRKKLENGEPLKK